MWPSDEDLRQEDNPPTEKEIAEWEAIQIKKQELLRQVPELKNPSQENEEGWDYD